MSDWRQLSPDFWASPQIAPGDLEQARALGITRVVNNRPDFEAPGQPTGEEIARAAAEHGLAYLAIPVTHAGIGPEQVAVLRDALASLQRTAAAAGKPMWMIGPRGDELVRAGWRFICIGEPTAIMASALRQGAGQARGAL